VPFSTGSISQSSTYNVGKGALLAALDAKTQVFELASKQLGVSPEALDTREGSVFVKADPARALFFVDLFRKTAGGVYTEDAGEIVGKATWVQPSAVLDPDKWILIRQRKG
jgi:CO/xanthine dehydrogenase Mo-binding subunit